jgi:hypothetical protein
MMSYRKFLDYEVTLLLAKYGESAVLGALAKQLRLTPEQLEALLQSLPVRKPSARSTKGPSLSDLVDQLAQKHPDKAEALRKLQSRLDNRTFLAELKDVRLFLDRRGSSLGSAQSRSAALPKVLKLLAELDVTELEELSRAQREASRSSLGMISDEILRRGRRD